MNARTSLLALAAILAGCVSAPAPQAVPAATGCSGLGTELARALDAKRAAVEKQETAWKAVIPFAIAARHAAGKSEVGEADKRIAHLRELQSSRHCTGGDA